MTVKDCTIGFANRSMAIICSISLMSAVGCSPRVIIAAKDNNYRIKISKDEPDKPPEIVVIDASPSSPPASSEILLKSAGYHRIEVALASGKKLADFNTEIFHRVFQKTKINIAESEVLIETQTSRFSLSSTPVVAGALSVVFFGVGGGVLGNVDTTIAKGGMCADIPVAPATQCKQIFFPQDASSLRTLGYTFLAGGVAFLGVGVGFTIYELRKRAKKPWSPVMRLTTGGLNP